MAAKSADSAKKMAMEKEAKRKALLERAAALKKASIESKTIKPSRGSVKVVAPTADAARATANKKEELRLKAAKSGLAAKNTSAAKESIDKKVPKPKATIKINSGGTGLTGTRGGGGGFLNLPKNR